MVTKAHKNRREIEMRERKKEREMVKDQEAQE
jgi:hypothetical protein